VSFFQLIAFRDGIRRSRGEAVSFLLQPNGSYGCELLPTGRKARRERKLGADGEGVGDAVAFGNVIYTQNGFI